jgi:hypothetical protein
MSQYQVSPLVTVGLVFVGSPALGSFALEYNVYPIVSAREMHKMVVIQG